MLPADRAPLGAFRLRDEVVTLAFSRWASRGTWGILVGGEGVFMEALKEIGVATHRTAAILARCTRRRASRIGAIS